MTPHQCLCLTTDRAPQPGQVSVVQSHRVKALCWVLSYTSSMWRGETVILVVASGPPAFLVREHMAGSSPAFLVLTAPETVSQYQTEKSTDPRRGTLNTAAQRILIMPFIPGAASCSPCSLRTKEQDLVKSIMH